MDGTSRAPSHLSTPPGLQREGRERKRGEGGRKKGRGVGRGEGGRDEREEGMREGGREGGRERGREGKGKRERDYGKD